MSFSDTELEYLSGQRLGRLATAQPDGTLQISPVGFRYNGATGTIDVAGRGMAASKKYRNVADNGQVAFVIDDFVSLQPWRPRCLEIRGGGEAIAEPTDSAWATDLTETGFDGAIIRIRPKRIISFGIGESGTDVYDYQVSKRTVG
ncbi:pyridoxamine 5'-phosphate oxidase family protein [Kribbella voronezhensis]|uniref:Pyridoxamine 5'-phosphate oxidase family protein n=1 Tax=Kribbella voronezhensis TaxID=2512212 RepID=A0A4R7SW94_9ACTN|nr:PPOX class F420-dependent oxidoreductase [Kribbella voronezhensis]TDU83612.1 pyridoxamine 5'-phosphate oxidase family protein [Kribbella voronezhensis]